MRNVIILLLNIIFLSSCSDKVEIDGKWDDNIKLSKKDIEFTAGADSTVVTTEGDWWWITEISLADSCYCYCNSEDVNLESDSYIIKEDCFVVEKLDNKTIFIKMYENLTGNERIMIIGLQAGDYFDYIKVKQLAIDISL
ncbi:MAG: hypothetical protein U9R54_05835 [Bacteroidota bacterium]|nr:hypothetical protein [Bacteroidota bacterium]